MIQKYKEIFRKTLYTLTIIVVALFCFFLLTIFSNLKTDYNTKISILKKEIKQLKHEKDMIEDVYKIQNIVLYGYRQANTFEARLSAYTARPEETNDDYTNTSTMEEPIPGWTVAVSRDLGRWKGKRIYIEGLGVRQVNDYMNERYKDKQIDILVHTPNEAFDFGVQKRNVYLIEPYLPFDKEKYCKEYL